MLSVEIKNILLKSHSSCMLNNFYKNDRSQKSLDEGHVGCFQNRALNQHTHLSLTMHQRIARSSKLLVCIRVTIEMHVCSMVESRNLNLILFWTLIYLIFRNGIIFYKLINCELCKQKILWNFTSSFFDRFSFVFFILESFVT